jgi:hypothetical protein
MHNPLLVGLVAFALRTSDSISLTHFNPRLLHLLKDLVITDDWDQLPWYAELHNDWMNRIPAEVFTDLIVEFKETMSRIDPEHLLPIGAMIRMDLLVDNAPAIGYPIKTMYSTFTVQWEDGLQIEYNCRPFNLNGPSLNIPLLAKLSHLFADQFAEACIQPGLDTFHDQVAKPFEQEKFQELLQVLDAHVNAKNATDREAYKHILIRLQHQFGSGPEVQMPSESQPLEFIEGEGGFK